MMDSRGLHLLIAEYVSRQQLVVKVIRTLRPDKFIMVDPNIDRIDRVRLARQVPIGPDLGVWEEQGQWRYLMHGMGCRLENFVTGEPLDWDVPDPLVFDLCFFEHWLRWLRKRMAQSYAVDDATFRKLAQELEQNGVLEVLDRDIFNDLSIPPFHGRCRLLKQVAFDIDDLPPLHQDYLW